MNTSYQDQFGFLPKQVDFEFSCGEVRPQPDYDQVEAKWKSQAHPDNHIYRIVAKYSLQERQEEWEKFPNSDRPALIYRLPWTHLLKLHGFGTNQDFLRKGIAGFLLQWLGFLYGYRVQFHDWWIEGKVSVNSDAPYFVHPSCPISACVDKALKTWRGWDDTTQRVITNALYLFLRTDIYEFMWERFAAEYMVFDAVYKVAVNADLMAKKNIGHRERLQKMAQRFYLLEPPTDHWGKDWTVFFSELRNDLLHEVRWDGNNMMGTPGNPMAEMAPRLLHELTRRLLLAVLGIKGPYLQTAWWHKGTDKFNIEV